MAKKILMVLTSHSDLGDSGEKTGFWLEEFATPYYVFSDAGCDVVLASPQGGQPPFDPKSDHPDFQTDATRRYAEDKTAQAAMATTRKLAEVDVADFDAVFYPGGHGPLWDLTNDAHSIALIEGFLRTQKPVAAVCHAPAVLLNVKGADGTPAIKGKTITGFSNNEEAAVGLTDVVPFLLEDEIKKRGAEYQKAEDWAPFAIADGLLITGQNPQSSEGVAKKLLAKVCQD